MIEGVRNDADGKRKAQRVVSQMENMKIKEVRKLKAKLREMMGINELLHKEKTQRESELVGTLSLATTAPPSSRTKLYV